MHLLLNNPMQLKETWIQWNNITNFIDQMMMTTMPINNGLRIANGQTDTNYSDYSIPDNGMKPQKVLKNSGSNYSIIVQDSLSKTQKSIDIAKRKEVRLTANLTNC